MGLKVFLRRFTIMLLIVVSCDGDSCRGYGSDPNVADSRRQNLRLMLAAATTATIITVAACATPSPRARDCTSTVGLAQFGLLACSDLEIFDHVSMP